MKTYKMTAAITATLLMTSASALANVCEMQGQNLETAYQHIPEGELETVMGFQPITEWTGGTIITNNTDNLLIETPSGTVGAYRNGLTDWGQSGWGQLLLIDATQSDQSRPWIAPAGYDGIYMYYDNWRLRHSDGINRIIPCINPGSEYKISADGATKGELVWSYSYFKTGEEAITTVKLSDVFESNNAWVDVDDTFTLPFDVDVTKDFIISLRTVGEDTADISNSDVAPIFADNFSLIEKPFESEITEPTERLPENELDASTVYPDVWPKGAGYISSADHGNYSPELNGIYIPSLGEGIVMVLSDNSNSGDWSNCAHAHPNADSDSDFTVDRCLAINWRGSHEAGIARVIEDIVPGGSYIYSVEGAAHFATVLSYSYTKLGESEQTKVILTEEPVSASNPDWPDLYHWHTMEEEFTAPRDIDVTKPFQLNISTDDSEPLPNNDGNKRVLYAANFSLIEMPVGGDTDEDGVVDSADAFPENPAAAKDTDGDGMPDEFLAACEEVCVNNSGLTLDDDDDNDGVLDINDGYPLDDSKSILILIESTTAIAGAEVMLDASATIPTSDAPDTTYTWEQTMGGAVELIPSGQTVTFTPAASNTKIEAEFKLTVESPTQTYSELYPVTIYKTPSTITANVVITGRDESNGTTTIETKDDNFEVIETIEYLNVMPGEVIVIDAKSSTDSDGFTLSYKWEHVGRWWDTQLWSDEYQKNETTYESVSFVVPAWNQDYPATIMLTLTNDEADVSEDAYENTAETVPVYLNIVRQSIPKKIHGSTEDVGSGSFGYLAIFLLGGLSFIRRLIKTQK